MKIPVIMLSGFLGSGKTTLLLSLLKESKRRGLNPGIIMNELGAKDVDGYILQESTGTRVEKAAGRLHLLQPQGGAAAQPDRPAGTPPGHHLHRAYRSSRS
ncbi:GTP-binding protein [Paenibacillus rhizoplanae]